MLALDDGALARLAIAATRVDPRQRRRWLRDIAAKLDPPRPRSLAARRQARAGARRKNGVHIYRLELSDPAVEGIIDMLVTTEKLTDAEAHDHCNIENAGKHHERARYSSRNVRHKQPVGN